MVVVELDVVLLLVVDEVEVELVEDVVEVVVLLELVVELVVLDVELVELVVELLVEVELVVELLLVVLDEVVLGETVVVVDGDVPTYVTTPPTIERYVPT